ncbi:MAG: hypothetical protein E7464_03775 [Ruminococcaceae bacterium]|nr:hypothetical protein [Oscillospiraceae bacterium]
MELPFENDSLELLEACAMALLPLPGTAEEKIVPPMSKSDDTPAAGSLPHRFFGSETVIKQPESYFVGDNVPVFPAHSENNSTVFSVEALSRAVERDARRFDANA